MSFNTIIEAEKKAENNINEAKEKAKQLIAEALSLQAKTVAEAKENLQKKNRQELQTFEVALVEKSKTNEIKTKADLEKFEQSISVNKKKVVDSVVARFK
ncbi:MAG: hypothetical protein R3B60_02835 [Candidatus Paceibacterota bacterium]